ILVLLLGGWHLLAMADAANGIGRGLRGRTRVVFGALALVVIGLHGWSGYVAYSFWDAGTHIFSGDTGPDSTAPPLPSAATVSAGAATPDLLQATPFATPPTATSRITILLSGIDSAPGRQHALTDTLMVVSIDPTTKRVAMVSVPRDVAGFPLYDGRTFDGKINSLMSWAQAHPSEFPDGPLPTVIREIGYIVGVPIQYFAAVDLYGFRRLIDAVGGVTVNVERPIDDPVYDWLDGSPQGFHLAAGPQRLDGRLALAYVRSRYGAGDNDFTRAHRQQQLLLALRDRFADPAMLPRLPELIQIAGDTVRTNFPVERLSEMLQLAEQVDRSNVTQVVLSPPTYTVHPPDDQTGGTYVLRLQLDVIARLSVQLFGNDSRYSGGAAAASPTAP
ncbi:MAG TPA: LCP family protein, partial [Candidatus Dormibacteraeota bacterium]|nr:LCP family protein [Candidatus Dormibacteraeota bacterium]